MTDRILSERGAVTPIDCDRFDALLADYLERALPADDRAAADAHLATCARCRALTDDLLAITRDAAALGPIEPPRDLWAGIAARIEAPVVPLGRTGEHAATATAAAGAPGAVPGVAPTAPALRVERGATRAGRPVADRFLFSKRWLAAAAGVLVAVSVGSTYGVMRLTGRIAPTTVAVTSTPATPAPDSTRSTAPDTPDIAPNAAPNTTPTPTTVASAEPSAKRGQPARAPRAAEPSVRSSGDARLVSGGASAYAPAIQAYDKEIASLRAALRNRNDLDSATVAVVERNLRVIDAAIADSRRALARDPHSRFLGDQLARTLDQKVELLRTAVLLPARS
jgi:Putative zinc-finger